MWDIWYDSTNLLSHLCEAKIICCGTSFEMIKENSSSPAYLVHIIVIEFLHGFQKRWKHQTSSVKVQTQPGRGIQNQL